MTSSSNMSIAFLDSSVENQKGGYIKPKPIKLIQFSMDGTFIVPKWHLVFFNIPIVCPSTTFLHISSIEIGATGQAEVARSMDYSQSSCKSAKGVFCPWVVSSDGGKQLQMRVRM